MRQISFGPTSYLEDSRQYSRQSEDEDDGQGTHISNESVGNSYSSSTRGVNEIIFYASENLFREGFTCAGGAGSHHRELAMKKYCKCKFAFDPSRTFQSYCFEFCGLLNIRMGDVRFYLGNREAPMTRTVKKPVIIEVQGSHGSVSSARSLPNKECSRSGLQHAIRLLLEKGLYSDIEIVVNGDEDNMIRAHRAILMARSERFRAMIESHMRESLTGRIEVCDPEVSVQTYYLLIEWIYEGECDLNSATIEVMLSLLRLTDEYLLADLQKVCEDTIIESMDGLGALHILTCPSVQIPASSEATIKEVAKSVLLDEYEAVERQLPDIEERISKVRGLMSELFTYKLKKKKGGAERSRRGRKGSIIIDDGNLKKRVRFNISSTIYEEASAIIHDESDSMIEPLSIYSNNSPPGELNDDIIGTGASSTRSLSMPNVSERRNSEGAMLINMNTSLNVGTGGAGEMRAHLASSTLAEEDDDYDQEIDHDASQSPRVRFNLRPASAGRSDSALAGNHSSLRRASSQRLEIGASNNSTGGSHSAGGITEGNGGHQQSSIPSSRSARGESSQFLI